MGNMNDLYEFLEFGMIYIPPLMIFANNRWRLNIEALDSSRLGFKLSAIIYTKGRVS